MENSPFRGLMHRLNTLCTSAKTVGWKAPRPYVKDIHRLILKHLPEGQGSAGTLSKDGGASACHFCTLLPCWCCLHWNGAPIPPFKIRKMPNSAGVCASIPALICLAKACVRACPSLVISCGSKPPKPAGAFRTHKGCPLNTCFWAKGNLCIWSPQVWNN